MTSVSRIAVIFYCLGSLDILDTLGSQSSELERETWRDWLWEQQICPSNGAYFPHFPFIQSLSFSRNPRNRISTKSIHGT